MKKLFLLIPVLFLFTFIFSEYTYTSLSPSLLAEVNVAYISDVNASQYVELGKVGEYTLYKLKGDHITAQALELIYEDKEAKYFLPSIESHLYVLVKGKEMVGIKEALKANKITIDQLQKSPLKIYKVPK